MKRHTINAQEFKYVNASARDSKQDIYAYPHFLGIPGLPNTYTIVCTNLPKGTYTFDKNLDGRKVSLHYNTRHKVEQEDKKSIVNNHRELNKYSFEVVEPTEVMLVVEGVSSIRGYVVSLRKQALANQQATLIQKQIKKYTDYGENYNRQSFYDTIDECFENNDALIVAKPKDANDKDFKYLKEKELEYSCREVALYKQFQATHLQEMYEKMSGLNR